MTKAKILERYKAKCQLKKTLPLSQKEGLPFELSHDADLGKTYIHTERFDATPICSDKKKFEDFSAQLQELYKVTFANPVVMQKYATGKAFSVESFEGSVARQSLRTSYGYPFSAFIVTDKENDAVVGFEVIGNSEKEGAGEAAYLFRKDYTRGSGKENVGYETVGALIWGYGEELYNKKALVNQVYDKASDKFAGGQVFSEVVATCRVDNIGSYKILENLGFVSTKVTEKYEAQRYEMSLDFVKLESEFLGQESESAAAYGDVVATW